MRSQGQVRFITITTKVQIIAAATALALLVGWAVSMGGMAISQYYASSERDALLSREANVAKAESRVNAYKGNIEQVTAELQQRQDFIEGALSMLPEDVVPANDTVSDSTDEAAKTVSHIEKLVPEAAGLARLEARQLAFVERLTRFADLRSQRAEAAIRKLGLDPRVVVAEGRTGMGGPFVSLGKNLDERFQRLGASMARMDALERGLERIPQYMPADISMISSGFGYRSDPFNGTAAMHSGLDFRGPRGAPIHATADGRVTFVGNKSGYGKTVEISHGNGLMTRYAHMSKWNAKVGQQVEAGDVIGAIGSTGRSTGPHLHFEVRINNRAVNPRPFLETAPDVLEEARAQLPQHGAKSHG